jgi:hypothetical protein
LSVIVVPMGGDEQVNLIGYIDAKGVEIEQRDWRTFIGMETTIYDDPPTSTKMDADRLPVAWTNYRDFKLTS